MSSLLRIRQLYPCLALNERRLADFLLSQPYRGHHLSSQKLAEEVWRQPVERGKIRAEAGL